MKIRTSLLIGLAIGYVLGAKAGRERYEQIAGAARAVVENPPIKQVIGEAKSLADAGTLKAREKMGDQLRDASELIRDKVS